MADIINIAEQRNRSRSNNSTIVRKFIDGEFVEYVDFDMLTPAQQAELLDTNSNRNG